MNPVQCGSTFTDELHPMPAGLFLIQEDGRLIELSERPYDSEALLQELLAKYPSLLAGDQFDAERPRRWLLVKRELGIPAGERQGDRWSVDHLLLDQDAIPTLVEVKRSTDTRIRREVVGQMLDYAANAVAYWPAERLQMEFEATANATGADAGASLRDFLGVDMEPEQFWSRAKTNLQAGKLRLIFVADEIPPELRRIIEFLNQQMDPTEVLGVEIRQFAGGGVRSLVPRVMGQTAEAERRKAATPASKQWDEESVFAVLSSRSGGEAAVARRLLDWARVASLRVWWGKGRDDGSFYPIIDHPGGTQYTVAIRTGLKAGYVQLQIAQMTRPFDTPEHRAAFVTRLNEKTGLRIDPMSKYPSIPLTDLARPGAVEGLIDSLNWVVAETRAESALR
jgi:hypothetical protein